MDDTIQQERDWVFEAREAKYKVEALAERLKICSRRLRREIRKHFGVSAKDYLRALQLNAALNLLMLGQNIKTAAADACYKTVQHFTREFKFHTGVTPGDYLKACPI